MLISNIRALTIRIGFGASYTIITIRNPQNPILIIQAPYIRVAVITATVVTSVAVVTICTFVYKLICN